MKLNRFNFLLTLLGFGVAAKAQTGLDCKTAEQCAAQFGKGKPERPNLLVEGRELKWYHDGKPLNNQCPTCGTMAKPYVRDTRFCGDYSDGGPGLGCDPMWRVTTCDRCYAAFRQDASPRLAASVPSDGTLIHWDIYWNSDGRASE